MDSALSDTEPPACASFSQPALALGFMGPQEVDFRKVSSHPSVLNLVLITALTLLRGNIHVNLNSAGLLWILSIDIALSKD